MTVLSRFRPAGRNRSAGARKTVTFGDASEVKGSPSWSVASLIFLFFVWWWIS